MRLLQEVLYLDPCTPCTGGWTLAHRSMNSDMSSRTMASSLPK